MSKFTKMITVLTLAAVAACTTDGTTAPPQAQVSMPTSAPSYYPRPPVPEKDLIRVALLAPLSGPHARIGEALLNAGELALFDARDPKLELRSYDTLATPEGAARAAEQAVADGAKIILGPLFSGSVKAVQPIAERAQIPVLAFSNDAAAAAPGTYVLGMQPTQEVERVIRFAASGQSMDKLAALVPEGTYGETVLSAFGRAVIEAGGQVRAIQTYGRTSDAMTAPVKRIADYDRRARWLREEREFLQNLNDDLAVEFLEKFENMDALGQPDYDAVLIAEGGQLLRTLAPLLAIYEVNPEKIKFLGTGLWNDPGLTREPPMHGAWFAAPPEDGFRSFATRYAATYGRPPARLAALSYDAVALVALLARNPQAEERFSPEALTDPNGFTGVNGLFRLNPDGITERGLAVFEITPEGFKIVSDAPASFERRFVVGALP